MSQSTSQGIQKAKLIQNSSLVDELVWDGETDNCGPMMLYLVYRYLAGESVQDLFKRFKNMNLESSQDIGNLIRAEFDKEDCDLEKRKINRGD